MTTEAMLNHVVVCVLKLPRRPTIGTITNPNTAATGPAIHLSQCFVTSAMYSRIGCSGIRFNYHSGSAFHSGLVHFLKKLASALTNPATPDAVRKRGAGR